MPLPPSRTTRASTAPERVTSHFTRWTRPRAVLLDVLARTREPVSARDVLARIPPSTPRIGLTTVYRTLELFANAGLIRRVNTQTGEVRFEYRRGAQDDHQRRLICTACNRIVNCGDFEQAELRMFRRSEALLARKHGFLVRDHNIDIVGLCPDCRTRETPSRELSEKPVKEGHVMRIAIATDEDYVSGGFGCAPFCTIVEFDGGGRITRTTLIPNPGLGHAFWTDLCFRNSIRFVVAGSMGPCAASTLRGRGIEPIVGVAGRIDDVARRFAAGELAVDARELAQAR